MPRLVILRHETPPGYSRPAHFDLMLESGGALRTWACEALPAPGQAIAAEQLADHRLDYLDFEGAVSGSRGSVLRVAAGDYEVLEESEAVLRVRLSGRQLQGVLTLVRDATSPQRFRISLAEDDSPSA